MTATTMPSRTPSSMASTVMISVVRAPLSTAGVDMLSTMKPHWNTGFVTSMWTNIAASTAMTPAAIHRPGCRTGTARICSGGAGRVVVSDVMDVAGGSADGRVHGRVVDRAVLDAPLLQHLLVAAVLDQGLDGVGEGLGELRLVLGDDVAVGRGVVDVTEQFELAAGLLDRVRHDRGVGETGVVLAGHDRCGGLVLAVVLVDRD